MVEGEVTTGGDHAGARVQRRQPMVIPLTTPLHCSFPPHQHVLQRGGGRKISRRQQSRDVSVCSVFCITKKWPRSVKNPTTFSIDILGKHLTLDPKCIQKSDDNMVKQARCRMKMLKRLQGGGGRGKRR